MKLAIMQPYLFPYLGYFQLAAAVDRFIFYDDVNYIKNGWINRNRLILSGAVHYFTVPLAGASPFQKIQDIKIQTGDGWRRKILASIRQSYGKAPEFEPVMEIVTAVLQADHDGIAAMARDSVMRVAAYLGLDTEFIRSSAQYENNALQGPDRVLDLCKRAGATDYYNLPGGRDLYDTDVFAEAGIGLHFITPRLPIYHQGKDAFVPGLSIVDVLMQNSILDVRAMLKAEP